MLGQKASVNKFEKSQNQIKYPSPPQWYEVRKEQEENCTNYKHRD